MTATRNKTLADLEKHFQIQMKNFEEKLKSFQEPAASVSTAGADTIESLKLEFKVFKSEITKKLENIMNEISQKNLSKNVLIYGINENPDEDLFKIVVNLFKNHLNIELNKNQLNNCYRLGKKLEDKEPGINKRPIVVEFVCQWMRDAVYFSKSKFKGKKIVLVEMLVKDKLELFKKVREKYNRSCWTVKGNIKVFVNNKIFQVDTYDQFNQLKINKVN